MENPNGLIAPPEFWAMSEDEINRKYYGCGPGKIGNWLVPDEFYGINIKVACQIHDKLYELGRTEEDKINADCQFLHNMYILIEAKNYPIFEPLCYHRAHIYYEAVCHCGHKAFWNGKLNKLTTC